MISTLLNYRTYANNLSQTLDRLSNQNQVARDRTYYAENIGKVRTVDEFLGNYRLYSYAMRAYGLEDQISAKGMMQRVLQSDLTDSNSYANKLSDPRFREFAAAFNFAAAKPPTAQSTAQTERLVEAYAERVDRTAPAAARVTNLYSEKIGAVASVDAFVRDRSLLDPALRAFGFADPAMISSDYAARVLKGEVQNGDANWVTFRNNFTAEPASGSTQRGWIAQTGKLTSNVVHRYNEATGNATSPQAKQANIDYFDAYFADGQSPRTIDDLVKDERLLEFVMTSTGASIVYEGAAVARYLKSDANMPNTMTAGERERFKSLRATLGVAADGRIELPAAARGTIVSGYETHHKTEFNKSVNFDTTEFKVLLVDVKSVSDLMATSASIQGKSVETSSVDRSRPLLNYVLKAFDIDLATTSLSKVRAVLTSDPTDPDSYVSKLKDPRFSELAAAFNFDENGKLRPERLVQSVTKQTEVGRLYAATFGTEVSASRKAEITADTKSYLAAVGSAWSLNDLVADGKTMQYALKAYGVKDTDLSTAELRRILTSDLGDPRSYANTHSDKAVARFAAAFNFEPDGSVRASVAGVQGGADKLATDNLYLLQTLEQQAGETSEGTRLSLYFLRKGPAITSVYGVLADKALYEVVRTALGLPDGMTGMDLERQAAILESRLDVADFADAAKLDKFVSRFAGMYDAKNTSASSNPILQLFGNSGGSGGTLGFF